MHGIKPVIMRVSNPYGERQRTETAQGAVSAFLHQAIRGLPIDIWGDGSIIRDYIHVSDVAGAFVQAVSYSGAENVFNISSGSGTSLSELVGILEVVLGRPIERRYLPGRPFDVPVSILCNALARQELKWKPLTSMHDGIARTAEWMEKQLAQSVSC